MPSFEFQGFTETVYPETRDVNGRNLGAVQPGDIRMFDDPPDWLWVPVVPPGASEAAGDAAGGQDTPPEPEPAPEPETEPEPGPVPAPPAVVPPAGGPAFAVTTGQ